MTFRSEPACFCLTWGVGEGIHTYPYRCALGGLCRAHMFGALEECEKYLNGECRDCTSWMWRGWRSKSSVAMFTNADYRSFMLRSKVQRLSGHFCMQVWSSVAYSVGLIRQHHVWHIASKKWLKSLRAFPVVLVPRQRCTREIMSLFLLGRASLPCLSSYFTSCSQKLHFSSTKVQSLFSPCSDRSLLPHQVLLQCIDWYLYIWKQIFA